MLSGLRTAQQGWLGKIIVAVLFGFLILSFGIWGIGDIFRITHREVVATVGSRDISTQEYRNAFLSELQRQSRQSRRNITTPEAIARHLDQQVLAGLMSDAALDQKAAQLGLALSLSTIAQAVQADPVFKGRDGKFDPNLFIGLLQENGYPTEEAFLREQRSVYLRRQIAEAFGGAAPVSAPMLEALHRFRAETRAIDYVTLEAAAAGDIAPLDDAALAAFYEQRKAAFAAPEYRGLVLMTLDPQSLAKPDAVAEADARAEYERTEARFGAPEKRTIERIPFKDRTAAEAAAAKIKAGASFDDIATQEGLTAADLSLGVMTKADLIDAALAEAAFALAVNVPSDVVDTKFGPVILRVTAIEPANLKPFEEVAAQLRQELAVQRARADVRDLHDKIEDQRASAKPVAEVAAAMGLPIVKIDAVDAQGNGKDGKPVEGIPDKDATLRAAFQAAVGGDTDAISLKNGGYVWYDVTGVEPARELPLAEVKDKVAAAWTADQRSVALAKKAGEMVKQLDGGTAMAEVAKAAGLEVKSADGLTRGAQQPALSPATINGVFEVKADGAGYALGADGQSRVVFKVKSATLPPADPTEATALTPRLSSAVQEDMVSAYVAKLEADLGATSDPAAALTAIRGQEQQ